MKKHLGKTVEYFTGSLFISMVIITFSQVIFRYVFNNSLTWSEELARYLFVWVSLFGAALAIKYRSHMAMETLVGILPKLPQKIVLLLTSLLMGVFVILLIYSGFKLIELTSNQTSTALNIPMPYIYYVFPISGALMLYYLIRMTVSRLKDPKKPYRYIQVEEVED